METNWPKAIGWIGLSEGGYVDHPNDPGGATNHGITRKTLARWRGVRPWRKLPKSEVKALTKQEAEQILKTQYWDLVGGDKLPSGVDYCIADYATNSGPARAAKELQRCLNQMGSAIRVDGLVGTETIDAVNALVPQEAKRLVRLVCERRMHFLQGLKTFKTFGKGWTRRVMGNQWDAQANDIGVIDRATYMVGEIPIESIQSPKPHHNGGAKAEPEQPDILDAVKSPGAWLPIGSIIPGLGAIASGSGPVQWGLFALMAMAALVGAFYAIKLIQNMDPA